MAAEAKSAKRPPTPSSSLIASASRSSSSSAAAAARGGGESKGGSNNLNPKSQSRLPIANEKRKVEPFVSKRPVDSKMKSPAATTVSKAEVKLKSEPRTSKAVTTTSKT